MAKDTRKFKKAAGTHLNTAGGTMTGDLVFGDDKKLTFGTGTDLEIYHTATGGETHIDGKNSRPVYIRAKDYILLMPLVTTKQYILMEVLEVAPL